MTVLGRDPGNQLGEVVLSPSRAQDNGSVPVEGHSHTIAFAEACLLGYRKGNPDGKAVPRLLLITVVIWGMPLAYSKVTSQGQISVPADIRRKLGIGPGSILEWDEEGDRIVVRRSGRYTSEDIHRSLFSERAPKSRTIEDMKAGIQRHVRERHARH